MDHQHQAPTLLTLVFGVMGIVNFAQAELMLDGEGLRRVRWPM